jgi:hypothetical protein
MVASRVERVGAVFNATLFNESDILFIVARFCVAKHCFCLALHKSKEEEEEIRYKIYKRRRRRRIAYDILYIQQPR